MPLLPRDENEQIECSSSQQGSRPHQGLGASWPSPASRCASSPSRVRSALDPGSRISARTCHRRGALQLLKPLSALPKAQAAVKH